MDFAHSSGDCTADMNLGKMSMSRSLFPSDEALLKLFNIERYKTLAEN
ncbi:hypothetical protein NTGBS_790049 [Candidatus Nitrotoga sp. BS]|nr:hypothetical protein NTGBS_790049 [Candidatus Nitrotoga sp. BS]